MEKKSNLKKILATASAFAMIAGSSAAFGAAVTDNGANLAVVIGGGADANTNGGAAFADNDNFFFTNAGGTLATGGGLTINSIDLNNQAPGAAGFTVAHNTTVGPIADVAGANTINLNINEGITLTLANNAGIDANAAPIAAGTFTGVGDIVLGGGVNTAASTLVFDTNATLAGTINSGLAQNSVVTINDGKDVTLNGAIGTGNKIGEFNVGSGSTATLGAAATATTFNVNNGTITTGSALTGNVKTNVDGTGELEFTAGVAYVGTIGADGASIKQVSVNGANTVTLEGNSHYAKTFLLNGNAASQFTVADNGVLNGNIRTTTDDEGIIQFAANGEINGIVGTNAAAVAIISSNGAGTVKINTAGDHYITDVQAANANSVIELANGVNINGDIDNSSGAVNATKLNFTGSSVVSGDVALTNAFNEINTTGDIDSVVKFKEDTSATTLNIGKGTVELDNTGGARTLTANVIFTAADADDAKGTLSISGANASTVNGTIATATTDRGTVKVNVGANTVDFQGQIGDNVNDNALNSLEVAGGSTAKFSNANVHINNVTLAGDETLEFAVANGVVKLGALTNATAGEGKLKVSNDTTLQANDTKVGLNFGTTDNRLNSLEFVDGKTLTLDDGINIHVDTLTNNANNGSLVFNGTHTFEARNQAQALNTVTLAANANVTILSPDTLVNGATTLGNDSTLILHGNYTGAVTAANAGNGTLKFANTNAVTLTGAVGANSLKSIEFAGGDVSFVGAVTHGNNAFVFDAGNTTPMKVTFDAATNIGGNVFTNNSTTTHTVVLGKNEVFTKNLATDITKQLNFQLGAAANAQLDGGDHTATNFTSANGAGQLNLNKAGHAINSAGTSALALGKVIFTENGTINNNTYSAEVEVALGKTATLGGIVKSDNFHLVNAGSTVSFLDGATVDSIIRTDAANNGVVNFQGGATINKTIGQGVGVNAANIAQVNFSNTAGTVASLGANINSDAVAFRQGTVKLTADSTLNGVGTLTNGNLDLADKTLTVAGGANGGLTFTGGDTIHVTPSNNNGEITGGNISIGAGSNLTYAAAGQKLTVKIADNVARPTGGTSLDYTIIENKGNLVNALALGDLELDFDTTKFTNWVGAVDAATGNVILTATDNATFELKQLLVSKADATDNANIDAITAAAAGSDASKFVRVLEDVRSNVDKVDEALDRVTNVTTVTDSLENGMAVVSSGINTRITTLAGSQAAPAAGDDHERYGAWMSPFYSQTTQKARKGAAGYKDETFGASFGFDTKANDDLIIGGAFTASGSTLNHKNFKSGDKTKVNSLMLSMYGMQQITDTWFMQSVATVATNEVRNEEKRVSSLTGFEVANGKYTSMSFSAEAMFGYNHAMNYVTLTPMAGVRYTRVNDGGYKETGTSFQNLNVSRKDSNKFEVIAGGRVSGAAYSVSEFMVTPEAHAFVSHDFVGKNPKASIELDGTKLTAKSRNPIKTRFNLGFGVNAEHGVMEYGAGYDLNVAEKSVGHQGTLRLRVNF